MKGSFLKMIFVIDESGSMHGTEQDVIGGINKYISQQQKNEEGKVHVSFYKFNDVVKRLFFNKPINEVELVSRADYSPSGFTALNDAVGQAIRETDAAIADMNEANRPDKVLMIIITDGMENASQKFSFSALRTLIATHENLMNWDFVYLGANLDNFADADHLGINRTASTRKERMQANFHHISESTMLFRKAGSKKHDKEIMKDLMDRLEDE